MADTKLELEVDVPGFQAQMAEAAKKGDYELGKIGQSFETASRNMVERVKKQFSGLHKDVRSLNEERAKGVKLEESTLRVAQEVVKAHRDAWTIKKAQQIAEAGGPGAPGIGPQGGIRRDRSASLGSAVSAGATLLNSGAEFAFSGGSAQGVVGLMRTGIDLGLGALGAHPGWKQLTDVVSGIAMQGLNAHDKLMESGLRLYQVGGEDFARKTMAASHYGLTQEQWANMNVQFARRGGAASWNVMDNVAWADQAYGLGSQTTGLLTNMRRGGIGGAGGDDTTQGMYAQRGIGTAIALGMQQGLDRARFGEVMDQLSRQVEGQRFVTTDVLGIANRMLFIAEMGPQYKGDTAAARQMESSLQTMAGGGSAYTQVSALRAAGLGKGASYAEASLRVASGLSETDEGLLTPDMLRENLEPFRAAWERSTVPGRAMLALQFSQLAGINQRDAYRIMERYFKAPLSKVVPSAGYAAFSAQQIPTSFIEPRAQAAAGEGIKEAVGAYAKLAIKGLRVLTGSDSSPYQTRSGTTIDSGLDAPNARFEPTAMGGIYQSAADASDRQSRLDLNTPVMKQFATGASSQFGDPRRVGGKTVAHQGVDLYFPPGTAVYAPEDGTITKVGPFTTGGQPWVPENGYMVVLAASFGGKVYKLMHLEPSTVRVRNGQQVTQGNMIGTTKKKHWASTKSHLHVETMLRDAAGGLKHVDPQANMNLRNLVEPSKSPEGPLGGAASPDGGSAQAPLQVNVVVQDRTSTGVNVQQAAEGYRGKASISAPGEAAAVDKE